uniref:Uncharacterized protein n=1 Tax=Nelumbo nucifera TaxID=4432 RepID=A0A822XJ92_NELNU|nr:TPA_asm: hypothetical protein HUJ06_021236 [Nelumbo nucifera]
MKFSNDKNKIPANLREKLNSENLLTFDISPFLVQLQINAMSLATFIVLDTSNPAKFNHQNQRKCNAKVGTWNNKYK